jgi:hypothetical protein
MIVSNLNRVADLHDIKHILQMVLAECVQVGVTKLIAVGANAHFSHESGASGL